MKSILLALLSFACTLTSAAQSPPAQFASRTALIIGISTYSTPEISSLPGVAADRLMAEGKVGRLSGEGEAGVNGGPPGDLYVVIHLKAHAVFQREQNDLHCEMPISFTTAALGGDIEIPTLEGYAKIKIPAETQSGKVFRLRGKGIKGVRSSTHGDLLCHVVVETPVNLTVRQRELLNELEAINNKDSGQHNPRAKSWMDKVKEFFAE